VDLGRFSGNLIGFIVVMIVVPWTLIWLLRRVGRRWSTGSLYEPEPEMEGLRRPLRCRLNLFHRWRTLRTPGGERYQCRLDCGRSRDIPPVTPTL
jgi:hypothetical protein